MKGYTPPTATTLPNNILLPEVATLLNEGYAVTLTPRGNSMSPFIRGDRDKVVLRRCESPTKGDIVLATVDGTYVLHRVKRVEGNRLWLMGDGNCQGMEHCTTEDIKGKVIQIIRQGKSIDCLDRWERSKAWWWDKLLPVRRYLLYMNRLILRIMRERRSACL